LLESNTARVFFKMPDYDEDSPDAEFASDSAFGGPSPFQS
jgi:hypothetical protein